MKTIKTKDGHSACHSEFGNHRASTNHTTFVNAVGSDCHHCEERHESRCDKRIRGFLSDDVMPQVVGG